MVVLATKCYVEGDARDRALDGMNSLVANDIGELDVDWQVGVRDDDFVQVDVSGEDAEVARNVLAETWGRDRRPRRRTGGRRGVRRYPGVVGRRRVRPRRRRRRADSGRRDRPRQRVARAGRRAIRTGPAPLRAVRPAAATSATRTPSRAGCRTPSATACTTGSAGTVVSTLTRRLAARSARP